jgi:hypothetical protein
MTISLSTMPDGYGFLYGQAHIGGRTVRIDVLPPAYHWRGAVMLIEPDPARWILLIDGEERARCDTWESVRAAIEAVLAGRENA